MNPYQAGLVPMNHMVMPQPYMVAVRLPPGIAPPQRPGQSAALLPGMPLTATAGTTRFPTPPPGAVQASALQAAALTGMPTSLTSSMATTLTSAQGLTTAQPQMSQVAQMQHMGQMLQLDPNALKLAYSADPTMAAAAAAAGMQYNLQGLSMSEMLLQQQQQQQQQQEMVETKPIMLDDYNSDLYLNIEQDGYTASPLTQPPGFCFVWAGARATHGIKTGKMYYEVQIAEHMPTDFGDDHQEKNPHIVRVGWSIDDSSFQLGEEPFSYGYGGTGRFSQNNRFSTYGEKFGQGDIIGALLDLDSKPSTISYTKNGQWLGIAHSIQGLGDKALFPHILTKNTRFKVNFGQEGQWYPPPPGYSYLIQAPEKIPGKQPPEKKSDCEIVMIIGLPGAGKTTFCLKMQKDYPEKCYNIIGTDNLIDRMKVMGLPRKNNYHGRWDVLIDKATKCLNKLFELIKTRNRNYILDQTNVYPSARRRKMKNFQGFYRRAIILQPDDAELQRRSNKRTVEDGKYVPESAVLEMKANFKLPEDNDPLFDSIEYVELGRREVQALLDRYNAEGRQNQQPSQNRFPAGKSAGPFQPPADLRQAPYSNQASNATISQYPYGSQYQGHAYSQAALQQQAYGQTSDQRYESDRHSASSGRDSEPPEKRSRLDLANSGNSSALDLLKQEYAEEEQPQQALASLVQSQIPREAIKMEAGWSRADFGGLQGMQAFGQQIILDPQRALVGHSLYGQALQAQMTAYGNATQGALGAAIAPGILGQPGVQGINAALVGQPPPPPPELFTEKALRGPELAALAVKPEANLLAAYGLQGGDIDRRWQGQLQTAHPQPEPQQLVQTPAQAQAQAQAQAHAHAQAQNVNQNKRHSSATEQNNKSSFQDSQSRNRSQGPYGDRSDNRQSDRQGSYSQNKDDNHSKRQHDKEQRGGNYGGYRSDHGNERRKIENDNRDQGRDSRSRDNRDGRGQSDNRGGYQDRSSQDRRGRDNNRGSQNDSRSNNQSYKGGKYDDNDPTNFSGSNSQESSDSGDKPKRERRRPSKWDIPDESSSPSQAAAESGVSQEVMAKVAAIQQKLQQQDPEQQSQPGGDNEGGQVNKPMDQKPDVSGMPPIRGEFGRPRPPMGGRGGPGQRPPFRPMGPDQRFRGPPPGGNQPPRFGPPGDPRFGPRGPGMGPGGPGMGPGGPPGMGPGGPGMGPGGPGMGPPGGPGMGPGGPPGMGPGGPGMGPGGPPGMGPRGPGMGPGGPPGRPPFRPRGPPSEQGMRGGRPPFGGRPPPFGGRGMPPRGPRPGPGGRWPRPN